MVHNEIFLSFIDENHRLYRFMSLFYNQYSHHLMITAIFNIDNYINIHIVNDYINIHRQ